MKTARLHSHIPILLTLFILLWFLPDIAAWLDREPDRAWARVRASGKIVFATDASYPPFESVGSDGVFYGLDIDVAREVARRIGATAEFRNVGIDALYDVLQAEQADASLSALPIDPARLGKWTYSRPYFEAGLVLVAPARSSLTEANDLPGHTIAVILGSDGDAWLRRYRRGQANIEAVHLDSPRDALAAVEDGRADAALLDRVTVLQLKARTAAQLTSEPYAIAVWGDSVDLLAAMDRALAEMEADGTLNRMVDEWMSK